MQEDGKKRNWGEGWGMSRVKITECQGNTLNWLDAFSCFLVLTCKCLLSSLLVSHYSEDLCVLDSHAGSSFTSPACEFLAKKCLNNQQFHFLHYGSCQDGSQLAWAIERQILALNSTKKEPCGYDTCYDWETCSGKLRGQPPPGNALA